MPGKHRLTEINEDDRTAVCAFCGPVSIRVKVRDRTGPSRWRCNLGSPRNEREAKRVLGLTKRECGRCRFRGQPCQFDVHHRDRNHVNDARANLEVLCANCHRLEHADGK